MKLITQLIGILAAVSAFAATETHTIAIPEQPTDFTTSVTLPQFDPAVGTLNSATLVLVVTNNSYTKIENMAGSSVSAYSTASTTAEISGFVQASATNEWSNALARFDRVVDFAGTSGISNAPTVSSAVASVVLDNATVTGTGFFTLPVVASGKSSLTGVPVVSFNATTRAAVLVKIVYDFTPDCPPTLVYVKPECDRDREDSDRSKDCDRDREYRTEKRHR